MALNLFSFLVIGLLGVFLWLFRGSEKRKGFIWLSYLATLYFAFNQSDDSGKLLIAGLAGFTSIFYLISELLKSKYMWIGLVALTVLLVSTFFLANLLVEFNGVQTAIVNKFTVTGLGFGLFSFLMWSLIPSLAKGLDLDYKKVLAGAGFILGAIPLFFGSFGASELGVVLVMTSFVIGSFFDTRGQVTGVLGILTALLLVVFSWSGIEGVQLNHPDVLLALTLGVGVALVLASIRSNKVGLFSIIFVFVVGMSVLITLAGGIFELAGGVDALLTLMVGVGIGLLVLNRFKLALGIPFIMFFASYFFIEINEESADQIETTTEITSTEPEVVENLVPLDSMSGVYLFQTEKSKVDFNVLGKSKTKGAFEKVSGSFDADARTISVDLNLKDFTTFSKYRDEELQGDSYFKSDKYPKMTYSISSIKSSGDRLFGEGEFAMIGKSNPLNVDLKIVEKDKKYYLQGNGKLNRTEYGMTPNSTEGNEVEFTFDVFLGQK